jgi:hypothetical protein
MSSDLDTSGEGTETVGQKLDTLSASVDKRFDTLSASVDERFDTLSTSVDERFDAVDVALIEQRQYTEFAFDRLADEMRNGFGAIEGRLGGIDGRLGGIDGRFNRLERKLDQFIDTQSRANELVERRLTALEPRSGQE